MNRRLEKSSPIAFRALLGNKGFLSVLTILSRGIISFLLSRSVVLGGAAPFGIGFVAAAGYGWSGVFASAGAVIGYLSKSGSIDSLRYVAETILIYTIGFVFRSIKLSKHQFFMPAVTGGVALCVSAAIAAAGDSRIIPMLIADVLLMTGSSYLFRVALNEDIPAGKLKRSISYLTLASVLFMSLSNWVLLGMIHPARFIASLFVLLSAFRGGAGVGSATGLCVGLTMDLALGRPFFSMAYGLSGFLSGVMQKNGKLPVAAVYVVAGGALALWSGSEGLRAAYLAETFVASVLFMLMPEKSSGKVMEGLEEEPIEEIAARRSSEFAQRRLLYSSSAFRELCETLKSTFEVSSRAPEDLSQVFEKTADKVCRRCALMSICWDRDAEATRGAFSDAQKNLAKKSFAESSDFPAYFSSRCVSMGQFLKALNEELSGMLLRRQYKHRLDENREQIYKQYSEMSRILGHVAAEVSRGISFDLSAEKRLSRYLKTNGFDAKGNVYQDESGRKWVELTGEDSGKLLNLDRSVMLKEIGACAGFSVSQPEFSMNTQGSRLIFGEIELFCASLGIASHKKKGETISGDSGTYFKMPDGKLYVILSDGMGSGSEAAACSTQAIKLLERFLKAGVMPEIALETLNSALVLKGEGGFVTVDLFICDLQTGEARFYKNGASPSFLKKERRVKRIAGKALPAGVNLGSGASPDLTSIRLNSGDCCILASDGVTGPGSDEWLIPFLQNFNESSTKELAQSLLSQAALRQGRGDDMTVMCIRIYKRDEQL